MFFKDTLTECFFVEPKIFILWHFLKNFLSTYILKNVGQIWVHLA